MRALTVWLGRDCGQASALWTAGRPRRRQLAALDPLPDEEEDPAGAGDELEELSLDVDAGAVEPSLDEDELSFVDEPFEEAVSDAVADLRLSVR